MAHYSSQFRLLWRWP